MNEQLIEAVQVTITSMGIVFLILFTIALVLEAFKMLPKEKEEPKKVSRKSTNFETLDDDAKAAVLVATIECRKQHNTNVKLHSIKRI